MKETQVRQKVILTHQNERLTIETNNAKTLLDKFLERYPDNKGIFKVLGTDKIEVKKSTGKLITGEFDTGVFPGGDREVVIVFSATKSQDESETQRSYFEELFGLDERKIAAGSFSPARVTHYKNPNASYFAQLDPKFAVTLFYSDNEQVNTLEVSVPEVLALGAVDNLEF